MAGARGGAVTLLLVAGTAGPLLGQEARLAAEPLPARVVEVAGANAYLDTGPDTGLAPGDTLEVLGDGRVKGSLLVVGTSPRRIVVEYAGEPFPLTRGDRLLVRVRPGSGPPANAPTATPEAGRAGPDSTARPSRPSLLEEPARAAGRRDAAGPRITGRLITGNDFLTSPAAGSAGSSSSNVSFADARLTVSGLPGGIRLRLDARGERLELSPLEVAGADSRLRVRTAALERELPGPLSVTLGRLRDPYDAYAAAYDGVGLELGGALSAGLLAGYEPAGIEGGLSSEHPKVSLFGRFQAGRGPRRLEGSASVRRFVGDTPDGAASTTFTLRQSARAGAFALWGDALLEERGAGLGLSHLWLQGSAGVGGGARLRLGVRRYALARDSVGSADRDAGTRLSGGADVPLAGALLGLDSGWSPEVGELGASRWVGARLSHRRLPLLGLAGTAAVHRWAADGRESVHGSASLSGDAGPLRATVGFGLERDRLAAERLTSRELGISLDAALGRHLALVADASLRSGDTSSRRIYLAAWWRL